MCRHGTGWAEGYMSYSGVVKTKSKSTRVKKMAPVRRRNPAVTEDEALNRICDERLTEPRYPIERLLKKIGYARVKR